MLYIDEILNITSGTLLSESCIDYVSNISFDSRNSESNSLFVALTSGQTNGHLYLNDAITNGANALLISDSKQLKDLNIIGVNVIKVDNTEIAFQKLAKYFRTRLSIPLIAITGSNGKTTTKDIISHVLSSTYKTYKTEGNLNNHLGVPYSILQLNKQHEVAVIEHGMNHAGEIDFLASISKPDISLITNIGDSHIEFFGSTEKIAEAKGELLPRTNPDGFVVLNKDDQYVMSQSSRFQGKVFTYSIKEDSHADAFAYNINFTNEGTTFILNINGEESKCTIPLYGLHNVSNVTAAALISRKMGISMKKVVKSLSTISISKMRFEKVESANNSIIINDAYNASPTSMIASIETLLNIYPDRKKVVILGDMFELGNYTIKGHQIVGEYLKNKDVQLFTVGNHSKIISDIVGGQHLPNDNIANHLVSYLNSDYALLFKASRGMKMENIISNLQPLIRV